MNEMNFDDFLSEVNEETARERALAMYYQELRQRLNVAMLIHHLPRLIDYDAALQAALQEDAKRHWEIVLREEYRSLGVEFDTQKSEDTYIRNRAEYFVSVQALREASWLASIMALTASYDFDQQRAPTGVEVEPDSHAKKHFIANVLINENLTTDYPWIIFMNDVIPGDIFDPQAPDGEDYIIDALEKHANREEISRKQEAIFVEAQRIAGIDRLIHSNFEKQIQTLAQLLLRGVTTHQLSDSSTVHAVTQRQADLSEMCRGIFSQTTTEALVAFIDEVYPLTD